MADHGLTAFRSGNPGAIGPRRIMAHVLMVAAGEFGDWVAGIVQVKTGNGLMQDFG